MTAAPTSFSACGPGPQQQANWEITVSNSDKASLAPGATWSNLQSQVHLANFGNFSPGTADWYSSCVSGSNGTYVNAGTFALYVSGQLAEDLDRRPPGVPRAKRDPEDHRKRTPRCRHRPAGGEPPAGDGVEPWTWR